MHTEQEQNQDGLGLVCRKCSLEPDWLIAAGAYPLSVS